MQHRAFAHRSPLGRVPKTLPTTLKIVCASLFVCAAASGARAQGLQRELSAPGARPDVVVKNPSGRVTVVAAPAEEELKTVSLKAETPGKALAEKDVRSKSAGGRVEIEVAGGRGERDRIDLTLRVPAHTRLRVETTSGAVDVSGALSEVEASTTTGTIRADVPTDALLYNFSWTTSRPRFYSEVELGKTKEKRGGRFELSGRLGDKKAKKDSRVKLDLTTERGVVVFGVEAASVPSDLRERQLTEAARGIIRSGNQDLIEAIRRVVPRYVGDYAATLPLPARAPVITKEAKARDVATMVAPQVMRLNASVTDRYGRAVAGLKPSDFSVTEDGQPREVTAVEPARTPFNLVLLLDVSGSVEERLDFIRKAALSFVNTVGSDDRVAITSFRDDVQLISDFTTDRSLLEERVKEIDAGGATALYDALAYTLVQTLRPLRGARTAIVVLSDGDDNRSFVPFNNVLEATVESGALIYPLYIPSGLIPASGATDATNAADPVRTRYLTLTSRADAEGRKLAEVSGGVYYPITRLDELQRAYDDVAAQLRTSYTVSYTSSAATPAAQQRVRVRVNREGATVRLSPAVNATP
ncbi:MAG: VWA domain-containing protein [Acidobacteria bacterium]|nr:VWA domain-containing protein [Acidobacteriota bacterium]MCA1640802.1 VWA domain-containing protein [Acidobacteriota bacterium]